MLTNKPKHILISPLDWGLGHTTRCIPLIGYILSLGHIVTVACNASQRAFIEETFGHIDIIHLEGYNIRYSKWNKWAQMGILSRLPSIRKAIRHEHQWLQKLSAECKIDGIISDNRYGLFHPEIPSVILTHQLQVQTGMGHFSDLAVQKIHYTLLNRFNNTWVVDTPGIPNLGGRLSHSSAMPQHTAYLGLLSRFSNAAIYPPELAEGPNSQSVTLGLPKGPVPNSQFLIPDSQSSIPKLLILLSGPEPQRSALSRILWQQALRHQGEIVFIEGCEQTAAPPNIPQHITYHARLTHRQLAPLLLDAGLVICRSGYSTLMDLVALQKKAILIPTPGQTEQQYLANHLHSEGVFFSRSQQGFNMEAALQETKNFPFNSPGLMPAYNLYKDMVGRWLETL